MSVIPMKRLTAFVRVEEADRLTKRLQKLRCVQITQTAAKPEESLFRFDVQEKQSETAKLLDDIDEVCTVLDKYDQRFNKTKKGLFPPPIAIQQQLPDGERERLTAVVEETKALLEARKAHEAELSRLQSAVQSLKPWEEFDLPPAELETARTVTLTGTLPPAADIAAIADGLAEWGALSPVSVDKNALYVSFLTLKENTEEAQRQLSAIGFARVNLADGTPEENGLVPALRIGRLLSEGDSLTQKELATDERLCELTAELKNIKILSDEVASDLTAWQTEGSYARTRTQVMLEGWTPEPQAARVGKLLTEAGCAWELSDPEPGDDVPILLKNNPFAESFELVLGMYSYPKYGTYDPTFIMSIFYFVMFGMMFADVGYGLLLVGVCFGLLKFTKVRGGLRKFLAMFGYCGISCTVCGVLFGGYFSDLPLAVMKMFGLSAPETLALTVDPLKDSMSFLIISLAVGAVHLIAGMAVKFVILCKQGKAVDAVCDIATYWLLFLGIGAAVAFPGWGKWVAVAGALSIVLTQGREKKNIFGKLIGGLLGLYGVVNYVSDLLSYSRILALGLASAVVGQVVNTLATLGGPTPFGFVLLVLVFLIGHALNIAINLLGTFVHTARLQYIEFFGKFYEDGGSPFKPVSPVEKYTELVESATAVADKK